MSPPDRDPSDGTYLLRRIDQKIDTITEKLEQKADRSTVHSLQATISAQHMTLGGRIDKLADRVAEIERRDYAAGVLEAAAATRFTKREKIIGGVVAVIAGVGTLVNIVVALNAYG